MNIYITLDYELFLGKKTGTPKNCLFRPMSAIMDMLDKTRTKLTVFVDGAYLYRMNELKDSYLSIQNDLNDVVANIKEISDRGHSVQYHFHPQWLYSTYDEEKGWNMDLDHYKLSDVDKDKLSAAFRIGKEIIEKVVGKKLTAFRAGGYSLCSYAYYGRLFNDNGIKIDSSVLPGKMADSKFQVYDYRKTPSKSSYTFKEDICTEVNGNDGFLEIPISSISDKLNISIWTNYLFLKIRKKMLIKSEPIIVYGDGLPVSSETSKGVVYWNIIKNLLKRIVTVASADSLGRDIFDVYSKMLKQGRKELVIIGHPKSTTNVSIDNLGRFIDEKLNSGDCFCTIDTVFK